MDVGYDHRRTATAAKRHPSEQEKAAARRARVACTVRRRGCVAVCQLSLLRPPAARERWIHRSIRQNRPGKRQRPSSMQVKKLLPSSSASEDGTGGYYVSTCFAGVPARQVHRPRSWWQQTTVFSLQTVPCTDRSHPNFGACLVPKILQNFSRFFVTSNL